MTLYHTIMIQKSKPLMCYKNNLIKIYYLSNGYLCKIYSFKTLDLVYKFVNFLNKNNFIFERSSNQYLVKVYEKNN